MNKNERPSFFRGKGTSVGIVICFVAVIAIVGAYTFTNYRQQMDGQVARSDGQEETLTEEETGEGTAEAAADDVLLPVDEEEGEEQTSGQETENSDPEEKETPGEDPEKKTPAVSESEERAGEEAETGSGASGVWFSEESTLIWPASGAVLIGYSMDQTVFFSTLEQYKYNPALIIGGEAGETIHAAAPGIVTAIETTAQTGVTVTMDMGNGYSAVYGQLESVSLEKGDYVASGGEVGILGEPTIYYSVEGPNLYFQILKDGKPTDPLNYMD